MGGGSAVSLGDGYLRVAFGSGPPGASVVSGVPSSKQKFRERSVYVRLHVGQRFIAAQLIRKVQILSRDNARATASTEFRGGRITRLARPAEDFHWFRRVPLKRGITQWNAATAAEFCIRIIGGAAA